VDAIVRAAVSAENERCRQAASSLAAQAERDVDAACEDARRIAREAHYNHECARCGFVQAKCDEERLAKQDVQRAARDKRA
jgi:hypothetical protein